VAAKVKFKSFEEFARHFNANDGPKFLIEQEANEFAGRLLVPIERLQVFYDTFAVQIRAILLAWRNSSEMRQKFAESVAPKFGVHPDAILARLDREGLWPSPQ
jgi:Zn-dependent peptidase ImmA (M78 family)